MKQLLRKEINKLIDEEWNFLYENYNVIERKYAHRTELRPPIIDIIKKIKDQLLRKLGYISVFFFIQMFFSLGDYPNPYKNIDKALLVLYQIVS